MSEEEFRILKLRAMSGVRIDNQLGVRDVLLHDVTVDLRPICLARAVVLVEELDLSGVCLTDTNVWP